MSAPHSPTIGPRALAIAAALLAFFACWGYREAHEHSATFDEPGFLVAGWSYLAPGAPEIVTTNLRLAQLWLAAPLVPLQPKLPDITARLPPLITGADSDLGRVFLADERHDGVELLRRSRIAALVLGLVLGAVLFVWNHRLFGEGPALLTLSLFSANPVLVSNSALATTDVAVTLAFVVATWTTWRLLHRITAVTLLAAGAAVGALLATKLSGLLIVPIIGALLVARIAVERPFFLPRLWLRLIGALLAAGVVAWAAIWLVYGLRFSAGAPMADQVWSETAVPGSALSDAADWLRAHRLMPEAWLVDLRVFATTGAQRRSFLLGEHAVDGWWYFFPVVWFFKTPLAVHVALVLGVTAAVLAWKTNRPRALATLYAATPLLALGIIYGVSTMGGRLNIGIRHWLPVFPLVLAVAGLAAKLPWPRLRAGVLALVLAWSAIDAWHVWPHPLAFVNPLGGGVTHGYRTVVDSSFDWGADLNALERWLAARAARPGEKPPVYFSHFGNADLSRRKIDAVLLPQCFELRPPSAYGLGPGTYVLSATMLQNVYGEVNGPWRPSLERNYVELTTQMQRLDQVRADRAALDRLVAQDGVEAWKQRISLYDWLRFTRLCAWLRQREPSERITPGLLVFELSGDDLSAALTGPPEKLRGSDTIKGTHGLTQEQLDFRK